MRMWVIGVGLGLCGVSAAQSFAELRAPVVRAADAQMVAPPPTDFADLRATEARAPVAVYTPGQLLRMSEAQLIGLYMSSEPGPLPAGYVPGTVILRPGTALTVAASKVFRWTAWQGKYFHDDRMTNRMFGLRAITTPVEIGTSYVDGRPSIVLDYATSRPFFVRKYRDEVREVSPGIYLGIMHRRGECGATIATWFALDGTAACGFAGATPQAAITGRPPSRTGP